MYKLKKSVGREELVGFLVDLTAQVRAGQLKLGNTTVNLPGGALLEVKLEEENGGKKLEVEIEWFVEEGVPEEGK